VTSFRNLIQNLASASSEDEQQEFLSPPPEPVYDSDFSRSSSSASDSEADLNYTPDPELLALVPACFWHPPVLPAAGFMWHCPVTACTYSMDLLRPTNDDVEGLPSKEVNHLRAKQWVSRHDDRVMEDFYRMVSRHWCSHLDNDGIRVKHTDTKVFLFPSPFRTMN
jgi:hypothetical protein